MFMCVMKGDETRHETPTRVKKVYFLSKFHPAHNLVLQIAPSPVYNSQGEIFSVSWQNLMKRRTLISFNMRQSCNLCWCCKKVTLAENRSNELSSFFFLLFSNLYARCGKINVGQSSISQFFTASCARSSIRPSASCVAINVNFPPEMSICSSYRYRRQSRPSNSSISSLDDLHAPFFPLSLCLFSVLLLLYI